MFWNNNFDAHRAYILRQRRDREKMETYEVSCSFDIVIIMTARRSNQSILKEISPEYSLEGLMLKLKFQYLATWCKELTHCKRSYAGKDWRWEEKGMTENEMVGWHHQLNRHEFESTLGVGDGQGSLACWGPWGCKESHMTERLNWTENGYIFTCFWLILLLLKA